LSLMYLVRGKAPVVGSSKCSNEAMGSTRDGELLDKLSDH
jgi:hypothetical protein